MEGPADAADVDVVAGLSFWNGLRTWGSQRVAAAETTGQNYDQGGKDDHDEHPNVSRLHELIVTDQANFDK